MAFTAISNYSLKSTNYSLAASDDVVQFNCAGGSFTATLPDATLVPTGKRFEIRRSADAAPSNTLVVNTTSSQTIDGRASGSIKLSPSDYLVCVSDGSNWQVVILQETTTVSYLNSGGQSIPNSAVTAVTSGWVKYIDTHSALNTSTGIFTSPSAGKYLFNWTVSFPGGLTANTGVIEAVLLQAGSTSATITSIKEIGSNVANTITTTASWVFILAAGDTVTVSTLQNNGAARSINSSSQGNFLSISKTGN